MSVKLLWKGAECWAECLKLLSVAESALHPKELDSEMDECQNMNELIVLRRYFPSFLLDLEIYTLIFTSRYSHHLRICFSTIFLVIAADEALHVYGLFYLF